MKIEKVPNVNVLFKLLTIFYILEEENKGQ